MLKNLIRKLDTKFFKSRLFRYRTNWSQFRFMAPFVAEMDNRIASFYSKNHHCDLAKLCQFYGSDKVAIVNHGTPYPWSAHTYSDYYAGLFSHCREHIKTVFECGIGTNNVDVPSSMGSGGKPGASLRVWRDYFPNAVIYGADIDKDILFEEPRIKTGFIDQCDPDAIRAYWQTITVNNFDFMIDDGLHTFDAGSTLFLNSVDKLSSTGIYVIEDVTRADMIRYKSFFEGRNFSVEFVFLFSPTRGLFDNNLVVIRKLNEA